MSTHVSLPLPPPPPRPRAPVYTCCTGWVCYAEKTHGFHILPLFSTHTPSLPCLCSVDFPGWVCYAEKTHGSYILPHIATARSPQGIMGSLVKQRLAAAKGWDPAQVYHVTVMPALHKPGVATGPYLCAPGARACVFLGGGGGGGGVFSRGWGRRWCTPPAAPRASG